MRNINPKAVSADKAQKPAVFLIHSDGELPVRRKLADKISEKEHKYPRQYREIIGAVKAAVMKTERRKEIIPVKAVGQADESKAKPAALNTVEKQKQKH